MKLCIDPGHGMSNKKSGLYDSGAVGGTLEEAGLVLVWAHELRKACEALNIPVYMTRMDRSAPTPVGTRAARAEQQGCTHLISLHINDAESAGANGIETLYRTPQSEGFADDLHRIMNTIGLRDRGVKLRTDLAVLASKRMESAMLEMGFIKSVSDMQIVTASDVMQRQCVKIANYLASRMSFATPAGGGCTCACTCGKRA